MKPLILLHGALGCKEQMKDLGNLLITDFDIHSFDFDGHGTRSDSNKVFDLVSMTEELNGYIDLHSLVEPIVFGYSMGGYAALIHACRYPGKLKKIITLATKFHWSQDTAKREAAMLDPLAMKLKIPEFADLLHQRHGDSWELVCRKTADMMLHLAATPIFDKENLQNIKSDVLICVGDRDKMVSLLESEETTLKIPKARLKVLDNTTHPLERVNTRILANCISGFTGSS